MGYVPLSTTPEVTATPAPAPTPVAPAASSKGYVPLSTSSASGSSLASSPAPASSSVGYQPISKVGLIAPKTSSPAPVTSPSPNPAASSSDIPGNALKGNLGGGYGASNDTDPYSGKPLLTYENVPAKSSQLLANRVAPDFDPTVPQKIDPKVLENGRMPESASEAVKKATGAPPDTQLDHLISLEAGGSNDTSNLNNENLQSNGTQPSLTLENQTAKDVASGKISYIQGQKIIARAKGVQLPDDPDFSSAEHPLAQDYAAPAPNQTGTQAQTKTPSLLDKAEGAAGSAVSKGIGILKSIFAPNSVDATVKNATENAITNFAPFKQLALMQGGQSFLSSLQKSMNGQQLNSQDLDKATARVKQLTALGVPQAKAAAQALEEARDSKARATALSSVGPLEGALSDDSLKALAQMTDPEQIVTHLSNKGIDPEAARAIAPIIAKASTPEAVKGVLTVAAEHGLLDIGKDTGSAAADEYAAQQGSKESPQETKALSPAEPPQPSPEQSGAADLAASKQQEQEARANVQALSTAETGKPISVKGYAGVTTNGADSGFRTPDPDIAQGYATERGGSLRTTSDTLNNPYVAEHQTDILHQFANQGNQEAKALYNEFEKTIGEQGGTSNRDAIVRKIDSFIKRELSAQGHDGVIYKGVNEYQVFNPHPSTTAPQSAVDFAKSPAFDTFKAALGDANIPTVKLDEQALNEAATKTVANRGKGINGLDADTRKIWNDYVNESGTSNKQISGRIAAKPFEPLRGQEMDAVHNFQAGERGESSGLLPVEHTMNNFLDTEQKAGIPVDKKANYLPQYWSNTPEEMQKAMQRYAGENVGKGISMRPGFSKESVFPTYKEGMQYGLTPKYNNIPDIVNARAQAHEKAMADRKVFDKLVARNLVVPSQHAPEGWKEVPRFPKFAVRGSDGTVYRSSMSMPEPLADLFNSHLNPPEGTLNRALAQTAKVASATKHVVLTSGIFPKTAINLHGFNTVAASFLEGFNKPSLFTNSLIYMFHPGGGEKFIDTNLLKAKAAALDGLILGGEDKTAGSLTEQLRPKGVVGSVRNAGEKTSQFLYDQFAKPLFEKMIPALKIQSWESTKSFLMSKGMSEAKAGQVAAARTNQIFGGLNYPAMGRDPNLQNLLKTVTLAPDFWEGRYKYTAKAAASVFQKGPVSHLYRNVLYAIVGSYLAMNLANKKTTGKWMFQNPAGHSMDVLIGKDSKGKNIWFRPFGTTLDLLRLPMDLAQSIVQNGDVSGLSTDLRDRVSTLLQPVLTFVENTDAFGNKIFGPATPTDSAAKQWGAFAATLPIIPTNLSGIAGLANPSQSKLQSVSQAAGAPLRFNSATPGSVSSLADMIYTQRVALETQIKKEYVSGDTQDALTQMAQFNQSLLAATIQSYEDQGYKVTDKAAFTQFLVNTDQAKGGLKDLFIKPPSTKSLSTAQAKTGQPLFNKIFPSNIGN